MAGKQDERQREILVPARTRVETLDQLRKVALPALAARLWTTCCWPEQMDDGWKIGDFRFLIVSFSPRPDANLYLQFWSEPFEPVAAEVCSGEWNPGAVRYLRPENMQRVAERGYEIGGRARNFQKEVPVESRDAAEAVAEEALAIVFDALGYRGGVPLVAEWEDGERSELQPIYGAVTPQDLLKLLTASGYEALLDEDDQPPSLLVRRARQRSVVQLDWQVPDENLFVLITVRTLLEVPDSDALDRVLAFDRTLRFVRVAPTDDGDLDLRMDMSLDGGVTAEWIVRRFALWGKIVRDIRRQLRPTSRRKRQPKTAVH